MAHEPSQIRCSIVTVARFSKQMSVLLGAGVPLHEALGAMTRGESDNLKLLVLPQISNRIISGYRFSSALAQFPNIFSQAYVALVKGAEESGQLGFVLDQLGDWLESQEELRRKIKVALTYPIFVVLLTAILAVCLFKTVIPRILETVTDIGAELPLLTKCVVVIVDLVDMPLFWLTLGALTIAVVGYLKTPTGRQQVQALCYFLPLIGGILRSSSVTRYCRTLSMLLSSGADLFRGIRIATDSSGNPLIMADLNRVIGELRDGNSLSESLNQHPAYPALLVDMLSVGETTGRSVELLTKTASLMEADTNHRLELFTNLLEPIILAGISLLVAAIVVAILLPMSNLISAL